jgi:riboflavin transporter FmnP
MNHISVGITGLLKMIAGRERGSAVPGSIARSTRNIGAAAVFGGLSLVLEAMTTPYLPRMPGWGIAFIDPVSIIWIASYLLFGLSIGVSTCLIGTVGLMFLDPFTPIGPVMKFLATIPIILSLDLGMRLWKIKPYSGESLKPLKRYIPFSLVGVVGRIVIMTLINIVLFMTIFDLDYASLNLLGFQLVSWNAVVIVSVLVNAEQSFWDCGLSYLLSFSTKLYDQFKSW